MLSLFPPMRRALSSVTRAVRSAANLGLEQPKFSDKIVYCQPGEGKREHDYSPVHTAPKPKRVSVVFAVPVLDSWQVQAVTADHPAAADHVSAQLGL